MKKLGMFIVLLLAICFSSEAQELKLPALFGDNMVMQQQATTPVWGWAKAGSKVMVTTSWNNKAYEATVNKKGEWRVPVNTPTAGGPYQVKIEGAKTITLNNVYIGEVWLASGQSNMSMQLKGYNHQPVVGSTEAILNAKGKNIHFVNIPVLAAYKSQDDVPGAVWEVASAQTAGECSAVCWFFADLLNRQLDVPIGIINASYGGSIVEAWMTPAACNSTGMYIPEQSDETSPWINNVSTVLYNGMIHPIVGYNIKGFLWYQGESNIFDVPRYASLVEAMVKDWRKIWNQGDFPFYFTQIAPYDYKQWNFFTPRWPEISAYLRESQIQSQALIPNSAMAVLMDVGDELQIHPSRKKEAGERLALLALAKTYGMRGFEYESPEYERMEVTGEKAIIHFSKQFMGLTSYEKKLRLFEIAGENKVFHKADAYIDGDKGTVVVSNPLVKEPKAVRYAFKDYAAGELFGTGGLPVSSFRTDNWE